MFDSKLTTYKILDELTARGIHWLTLRENAPGCVAGLGVAVPAQAVRQARAHAAQTPSRVLAAIEIEISNGRLEALNSKVRLL